MMDRRLVRRLPGFALTLVFLSAPTAGSSPQAPHVDGAAAPAISAVVQPAPNAAGWNRTAATVTFACAGSGSRIAACPDPVVVSADTPGEIVSRSVVDHAGHRATASVTVRLDSAAPDLAVKFPEDAVSKYY